MMASRLKLTGFHDLRTRVKEMMSVPTTTLVTD